jgi:hypothetical protein
LKALSRADDFALLKKRLENAVEDAVLEAERMAKHRRHAMEDVMEDTNPA